MAAEQMLFLDIAGLRIGISGCRFEDPGILAGFLTEAGPVDHQYDVSMADTLAPPEGELIYQAEDRMVYRLGDTHITYRGPVAMGWEHAHVRIHSAGDRAWMCFRRRPELEEVIPRILLNALDLPHLMTRHDGFMLHASFIEHEGRAILFTAPSETGKSTQAGLWCDHLGAELVNGDRAAVRLMDGRVYACGTPFSGSSQVRRNGVLPLGAIVYLSQAPENTVTRLRGVRAFRSIWEGCTVDVWDRQDLDRATQSVMAVLNRVPVYHQACTPDVRAAQLLKRTMEVEP